MPAATARLAASDVERTRRTQVLAAGAVLVVLAAVLGPLGGMLSMSGHGFAILAVAGLLLPVLFWKVPPSPLILCVISATLIERFPDAGADAITSKVPLFRSLQDTIGLSGVTFTPYELLLMVALLGWLAEACSTSRCGSCGRFSISPSRTCWRPS